MADGAPDAATGKPHRCKRSLSRTVGGRQREGGHMSADEGDGDDDDEVIITVPVDQQAGVWANWAAVNESDHAFGEPPPNRDPTRTNAAKP